MRKVVPLIVLSIILLPLCMGNADVSANTERTSLEETSLLNLNDSFDESISDVSLDEELNFEQFGDQQDFWFMNWEIEHYQEAHATLLSVGDHCYIYMQNESIEILGEEQAIERCNIVRDEFDNTIYPTNYELIGDPDGNLGDIDGDRHITVFLAEDSAAYFSLMNELPGYPNSNHREMVYTYSRANIYEIIEDVCHETNHLFFFNYDEMDAVFVYEGLAEFSKYLAGYLANSSFLREGMEENMTVSTTYFADNPYLSLFFFDESEPVGGYGSYGISYLFMLYLFEKYGLQVLNDISTDNLLDGPAAIEYSLTAHGYNISFNELFLDFITACTLDKTGILNDIYGFNNLKFRVEVGNEFSEFPVYYPNVKHRYYGLVTEKIWGMTDEFSILIEIPEAPRSIGVVIVIIDENGWNITKTILTGDGNVVILHCNGDNIDTVFLITSLIKDGTPPPITSFMACPYSQINIQIEVGYIYSTEESSFLIYLSILPLLSVSIHYLMKKKRNIQV